MTLLFKCAIYFELNHIHNPLPSSFSPEYFHGVFVLFFMSERMCLYYVSMDICIYTP